LEATSSELIDDHSDYKQEDEDQVEDKNQTEVEDRNQIENEGDDNKIIDNNNNNNNNNNNYSIQPLHFWLVISFLVTFHLFSCATMVFYCVMNVSDTVTDHHRRKRLRRQGQRSRTRK
jgi:hypothetical protein